ncbi:MAG: hypothetical protein K8S55_02640 [Phycisphaerae bacterium]|nr:hypothetical protein [Phycisphaerae bacterium]
MIPSDHFVRFYNEVFKFLDSREESALRKYWLEISKHQERHCLQLFKKKGLDGIVEYWTHIAESENCDMDIEKFEDHVAIRMNKCPSLSKVLDNDAEAFERYCDHCPGWVIPLIEKTGMKCEYDIMDRKTPRCELKISQKKLLLH